MDATSDFRQGIPNVKSGAKPDVSFEPFALAGEGLLLSIPVPSDAQAIAEHCQDESIQRWTTIPVPYGLADAQYFIDTVVAQQWAKGGGEWAIRTTINQETSLVGMIGLRKKDCAVAEIGYWLAPHARGKGILTKALRLVLNAGFSRLGFECVLWRAEVGNWDSWKCAWRLGFRSAGTLRGIAQRDGKRIDHWSATLLSSDPMKPATVYQGPGKGQPQLPDSRDPEALVRQFHEVYGLPINMGEASVDTERIDMRMGLILEETAELVGAVYGEKSAQILQKAHIEAVNADDGNRDVVASADALADLIYVIYGMALECGINLEAVLAQVQASNLSKLGSDGKPIYRADGKVLKGPKYVDPDIRLALRERLRDKGW